MHFKFKFLLGKIARRMKLFELTELPKAERKLQKSPHYFLSRNVYGLRPLL